MCIRDSPFAAHHLAGFLQDVVDAVAPVVGQAVRHVAVQPAHCLVQSLIIYMNLFFTVTTFRF